MRPRFLALDMLSKERGRSWITNKRLTHPHLTQENQVTEQVFVIGKPMFVGEHEVKGDGEGTGVEVRMLRNGKVVNSVSAQSADRGSNGKSEVKSQPTKAKPEEETEI
jgi:hypothetical protein